MLTLEELKNMKPGNVIAKGVLVDAPDGIHLTGTGNIVRWIAVRGNIYDRCIYAQNPHYGNMFYSYEEVRMVGDKITGKLLGSVLLRR